MRKKFILITALLAAAIGAFAAYYTRHHTTGGLLSALESVAQSPLVGTRRPDFTLQDFDGAPVPASTWDGQVVLLNFWASWCPPCRREIPVFSEVREFFHEDGFEVVGIAIDDREDARSFLDKMPDLAYPQLHGYNDAVALARELGNRSGGLPYSVLLDRDGVIRYIKRGELSRENLIRQAEALL